MAKGLFVRACVIAVLLFLPGAAFAGPVQWQVTTDMTPTEPSPEYPGLISTGSSIHAEYLSRLIPAGPMTKSGWRMVQVGEVRPDIALAPNDPGLPQVSEFWLTFVVRDVKSGDTGTIRTLGQASESIQFRDDTNQVPYSLREGVEFLQLSGGPSFNLGGTPYQVTLWEKDSPNGSAYIFANIEAGPNVTPEPGTFALAAFGLFTLGAGTVRRLLM
jgi:hypothetical protein